MTLADGRKLGPFDVILAATGYAKDYSYFEPAARAALGIDEDGLYLFRSILPPRLPVRLVDLIAGSPDPRPGPSTGPRPVARSYRAAVSLNLPGSE